MSEMSKSVPNIQMVDLKSQYLKLKDEIDTSLMEVVESCAFINGPKVQSFKKSMQDYLDAKYVIPCGNGTDALQIAMMALDLQHGDEVIVPAFTYVATAEVIALLGFKPIMVDVDPDTFNITPEIVEAAITPRTKAIAPVHLFGQSCDMEPIMKIAEKHNLWVIEDNAQAIGADYTYRDGRQAKTGVLGHIGCTSFYPSKNLGAYGDGGALYTNNDELGPKLQMIANHGQSRRYYHDLVGVNSRLDSFQAAVLDIKLKHLDEYADGRRQAANYYDQAFAGMEDQLVTPARSDFSTHVFHQYTLKVKTGKRDQLAEYLKEKGIPSMIYYPVPLYEQEAFSKFTEVDFLPVTDQLCKEVISLPMHSELSQEVLEYVTEGVKSFF
jgi:dTDP-4-amino-4,6-dideoxygalactose transaminase